MAQYLKSDCINNAFGQLRISGLTSIPGSNEITIALRELEGMAHEYFKLGICVGFNFEDTPDVNSSANIEWGYRISFEICLAVRMVSYFGKGAADKIDPVLFKRQSGAYTFLSGSTAIITKLQAPSRMPKGSGNEKFYGGRYNKFYQPVAQAPPTTATNRMVIGNIDNFVEHFDDFVIDTETIASYTIEASSGLTIVSDSLTTPDVSYQISATGTTEGLEQVIVVATADSGRVETRLINFELEIIEIA